MAGAGRSGAEEARKQAHVGFADFGLGFGNPDFVKHAESYGARGHRPSSAGEIAPLIEECFDDGGVHVIDVPVDYSENTRILFHDLRERSRQIQ